MDKITSYWVEHSEYDLETARAMLKTGRYLYVTFMCQQAIEKILKAIITTVSDTTPPRTHNLARLVELAGLGNQVTEEQSKFCKDLTPFCIETRYAEEREKLSKLANRSLAEEYLKKTEELHKWLKYQIK